MKPLLGFFGGLVFAGAGILFFNLAMANSQQASWGYAWFVFAGLYVAGFAIAMMAPTPREGVRRLLVGTGALLCGSAVVILVMNPGARAIGAVGVAGGANVMLLLIVGLALVVGGVFTGRAR